MEIISIKNCPNSLINEFSCGNEKLDIYFKKYAKQNDLNNLGKTFVLIDEHIIIGYYTLSNAQIEFEENNQLIKKLPKYPIPCIRIARLAINEDMQHEGYGSYLLKNIFQRIMKIINDTAVYFIIVDAKESSKEFYEHYGFIRLKDDSYTYIMNVKTIIKALS